MVQMHMQIKVQKKSYTCRSAWPWSFDILFGGKMAEVEANLGWRATTNRTTYGIVGDGDRRLGHGRAGATWIVSAVLFAVR